MTKPISLIAAIAQDNAIGKDNDLLWHISEDLKYFKRLTNGHTIVMGRKTFESFPKRPLPNRKHIIVSGNYDAGMYENCTVVASIVEALNACSDTDENFIIGGASIYAQFMPYAQKMYLTRVFTTRDADVYFPEFDEAYWDKACEKMLTDEKSGLKFQFCTYSRKQAI